MLYSISTYQNDKYSYQHYEFTKSLKEAFEIKKQIIENIKNEYNINNAFDLCEIEKSICIEECNEDQNKNERIKEPYHFETIKNNDGSQSVILYFNKFLKGNIKIKTIGSKLIITDTITDIENLFD